MFQSRHGERIVQILNIYMGGPGLIQALETYVLTQEQMARTKAKDELAVAVCEGLHNGPAKGLLCAACVQAEKLGPGLVEVEAEIAAASARRRVDEG